MARPASSKKNGQLTSEERRLAELEEQNRRRVQELEAKLTELPKRIEERKRKEAEMRKLKAIAATTAAPQTNRFGSRKETGGKRSSRKRDRDAARLKFLLLCLVLGSLLLLLWRSLP